MRRFDWDFDYRPASIGYEPPRPAVDLVIATRDRCGPEELMLAASDVEGVQSVEVLLERHPIFWYRVLLKEAKLPSELAAELRRRKLAVRYVTSSTQGSLALGERLDLRAVAVPAGTSWQARAPRRHVENDSEGRWLFHEKGGIHVDRAVCGTGAGTRLAVIDDEATNSDALGLDQEVLVGTTSPCRTSWHGSFMVAWAVAVRGDEGGVSPRFTGVAPDASPRLYLIPKPGRELTSLPRAIVRAVDDGADVVVCATNLDGVTSPLLDDALEFANRAGRGGKGCPVVIPTGREISSPPGSLHASLTLPFADPASDPRVFCVAPSGRDGGWFLWNDRSGKLRPFANRGPAVLVAAPGDDMADPFSTRPRMAHAESSGAAAIAAGVLLLVLGSNPDLTVAELCDVVASTSCHDAVDVRGTIADPADVLPRGVDRDGHDAKCGYGRLVAVRACLCASDPIAAALVEMGEDEVARAYAAEKYDGATPTPSYSTEVARWAAQVFRRDPLVAHAVKALLRHLRLCAVDDERRSVQPPWALARNLAVVAERFMSSDAPELVRIELEQLRDRAVLCTNDEAKAKMFEDMCAATAARLLRLHEDHGSEARVPMVGEMSRSA